MDRNCTAAGAGCAGLSSLSARRAWIEIDRRFFADVVPVSLSARRAWIEIKKKGRARRPGQVALRKESVDRNLKGVAGQDLYYVALRKESVDRNGPGDGQGLGLGRGVALRKESVDRNRDGGADTGVTACRSPQGERG